MQEVYKLWADGKTPLFKEEYGQEEPTVTAHLIDGKENAPCVIVFPGGGYGGLADDHEGRQICEILNENGYYAQISAGSVPLSVPFVGRKTRRTLCTGERGAL